MRNSTAIGGSPYFLPIVLLGAAGLGAWAYFTKGSVPAGAAVLATSVANTGPSGEYVFKPELAPALVQSLASQTFSVSDMTQPTMVTIAPQPQGVAVLPPLSALGWATQMNSTMSILAPLYLGTTTSTPVQRFLRAVPPGTENVLAGPNGMYAVLLYAGTLAKNLPPPGVPGTSAPGLLPPGPITPANTVASELPPDLRAATLDLLANGIDPSKMDALAIELDSDGFPDTAALLRKRAAVLRAGSPLPPLNSPNPLSIPQPAPPQVAPGGLAALLQGLGLPGFVPGNIPGIPQAVPQVAPPQVVPQVSPPQGQTATQMDALLQGLLGTAPLTAPPQVAPQVVDSSLKFVTAPNGLKVRAGAGVTFPEVSAPVSFGSRVQTVGQETSSGWTMLVSPPGFVCSSCPESPGGPWLSSTPPALAATSGSRAPKRARTTTGAIVSAMPPGVVAIVLAPSGLKLRSGPKTSYPQIGLLSRGAKVTVLQSIANGWTRVQPAIGGPAGFVCSTCVPTPSVNTGCSCG
jgi:hypothetical protein